MSNYRETPSGTVPAPLKGYQAPALPVCLTLHSLEVLSPGSGGSSPRPRNCVAGSSQGFSEPGSLACQRQPLLCLYGNLGSHSMLVTITKGDSHELQQRTSTPTTPWCNCAFPNLHGNDKDSKKLRYPERPHSRRCEPGQSPQLICHQGISSSLLGQVPSFTRGSVFPSVK